MDLGQGDPGTPIHRETEVSRRNGRNRNGFEPMTIGQCQRGSDGRGELAIFVSLAHTGTDGMKNVLDR